MTISIYIFILAIYTRWGLDTKVCTSLTVFNVPSPRDYRDPDSALRNFGIGSL